MFTMMLPVARIALPAVALLALGACQADETTAPIAPPPDTTAPVATVAPLPTDQTSLLFDLEIAAIDAESGVDSVRLWFRVDDGPRRRFGLVAPGIVRFQAATGGRHEFTAQAFDHAGNAQVLPDSAQAFTAVPAPIILVDNGGYAWDITNAVLKHRLHQTWWDHGLGRFTIRPVIDPLLVGPGEVGFPDANSIADVIALDFDGDKRAYRVGDITNREVVNDVVNGVAIAATY